MGQGTIENRIEQIQSDSNPFYATFRIGGLLDTRVGATSGGSGTADDDYALAARVNLGYQFPSSGNLGFSINYGGYADLHQEYNEFDVMEHSISIDASYSANDLIYSLPLGFSYSLEDGQTDSNRYSITPTLTYLMPSSASAVAAYGLAARIEDRDDNVTLDEDGTSLGFGFAYILFFEKISRARFSIDYTYTDYDSFVREYGTDSGSDENREDRVLTTSLDIQYHITPVIGIYTTYSFIHSMSNVDTYDYNRHILELGIALKY